MDEPLQLQIAADVAAKCADDARRHGGFETKGGTDGNRPVAHLHRIGIAHSHRSQARFHVNFQHGDVRLGIRTHHPCAIFGSVAVYLHFDVIHMVHHVVVRDDITVLIHQETSSRLLLLLRPGGTLALVAEEAFEQVRSVVARTLRAVVVLRSAALPAGCVRSLGCVIGRDVHHRRLQHLGQLGEFVAQLHRVWNHQRGGVGRNCLRFRRMYVRVRDRSNANSDR